MNIIPQEKHADTDALTETLRSVLDITESCDTRVFLFGSWATKQKSFTKGDVDVFVGCDKYDYTQSPQLATLTDTSITVHTASGDTYPNRRVELHWGDTNDFLSETMEFERVELHF